MKRSFLLIFFGIISQGLFSQRPIIELTFNAIDSASYIQLDSIKVLNRTQGGDTILYWPDTILVLNYEVGIPETYADNHSFKLFQNFPNPVTDQTTISLYVPEYDKVDLLITDILGRVISKFEKEFDQGIHTFSFIPGNGNLYFCNVFWRDISKSIKIICTPSFYPKTVSLKHVGSKLSTAELKSFEKIHDFTFSAGDKLLYIGYTDNLESGILDTPEVSLCYTFQFANNIPCPGTPTVEYEGQVYNTVQIFSQCWLKENLNVGTMIDGEIDQTNNGEIKKYCYNNEPDSCTKYGGLYQWDEMMQYTTQPGVQGICPPNWHLPTDEEWKVLEGEADSQYAIGDEEWDIFSDYRGYDAGKNLKTLSGWFSNGNGTDLFDFSGLPGGQRHYLGDFSNYHYKGYWWTSQEHGYYFAYYRDIYWYRSAVQRYDSRKNYGFSVRCIKDN